MNQYGRNFGRFMTQHHDLQRAYNRLKEHSKERELLMHAVRGVLFMNCNLLRLAGYTAASQNTHKLLEEIDKLEHECETPVAAQ